MDQLVHETITTVHPDTPVDQPRDQRTVAADAPLRRPAIIRGIAEREWLEDSTERTALMCAELQVMACEALASRWTPEQCRVQAVRIDGKLVTSLVCNLGGH